MHDFTLERKHLATSLSLSVSFSAVKCHDHVMSQTHEKNITNLRKINSLQFANKMTQKANQMICISHIRGSLRGNVSIRDRCGLVEYFLMSKNIMKE